MNYKEYLNEHWSQAKKLIKVRNPLFHASPALMQILDTGYIKSSKGDPALSRYTGTQSGISTSRNLSFLQKTTFTQWKFGTGIIVLDGDKIKQKYKIVPIDYWKRIAEFEFEERILSDKIPIKPYIKGIIMKDNSKFYYNDWASWKDKFNLSFDVVVYWKGKKYFYAKDLI